MSDAIDPFLSLEAAFKHAVGAEPDAMLTDVQLDDLLIVTRFCIKNELVPGGGRFDMSLFGYGDVEPDFVSATEQKRYWIDLEKLGASTAIPRADLIADWEKEWAGRQDAHDAGWKTAVACLELHDSDGQPYRLRLYSEMAILGLFMGLSPWADEFCKATLPAMRRAAVNSGLARMFDTVVEIADGSVVATGKTLEEVILADGPLPSAEGARHLAQAGPLATFNTEDGDRTA